MADLCISVDESQDCLVWTLARPERGNAIGPSVIRTLQGLLDDLFRRQSKPRILLIRAEPIVRNHRRTWIAGGDLKELFLLKAPEEGFKFSSDVSFFLNRLTHLPFPVLMVIDGDAIGGGAELALGGDIRLASAGSHFHFKQLDMGLPTGFGGAGRLTSLIGRTKAEALVYGGQQISAVEALNLGMLHQVAENSEALVSLVQTWVDRLMSIDTHVFAAQKRMFNLWSPTQEVRRLDEEAQVFREVWMNPTHVDKINSFLKRKQ